MISDNNLDAWGYVYDKYAPAMFDIISNLTEDKIIAEDIFKEAFLQLKEKQILSKITYSLYPYLQRYTHNFTKRQLELSSVSPAKTILNII